MDYPWWLREAPTVLATGLTFEQAMRFFAGMHVEFVDGAAFRPAPVNVQHQDLLAYVWRLLDVYLDFNPIARQFQLRFTMKLSETAAREPDAFIVMNENLHRLTNTYFDGAADNVTEVVQPGSESDVYGTKSIPYEMGGVREYWRIDPIRKNGLFDQRDFEAGFSVQQSDADGYYATSLLPRFRLHVPMLWKPAHPTILEVVEAVRAMWEGA